MGAPELLHQLRGAGLMLTLTPAGDLHVAPRSALTDDHRAAIRAGRDSLVLALLAEAEPPPTPPSPPPRRSGNSLMTPDQDDECHAGGWDDGEIGAFLNREARFTGMGLTADAAHLAERLTLRDRQQDDRHLCLECRFLAGTASTGWRCRNARAAQVCTATPSDLVTQLQRCPGWRQAT